MYDAIVKPADLMNAANIALQLLDRVKGHINNPEKSTVKTGKSFAAMKQKAELTEDGYVQVTLLLTESDRDLLVKDGAYILTRVEENA